jgi:hypothetical protein
VNLIWFLKFLGYEVWLMGSHAVSHIVIGSTDPSRSGHDILNCVLERALEIFVFSQIWFESFVCDRNLPGNGEDLESYGHIESMIVFGSDRS